MCGIAGFWTTDFAAEQAAVAIAAMTDRLAHRGPDSSGSWLDESAGIALGHRRLAILDLSPQGQQPMASVSGRYLLVFNGEIYNFQQLRQDLEQAGLAPVWRGHSDTEVLLAAIDAWGLEGAIDRCVGMFALALWDRIERRLQLARDRLGEKPLYYGRVGDCLLFASELKALRAHPSFRAEIDREALSLLLRHSYIPAPYCIYQGFFKLPPGTILTLAAPSTDWPQPQPYWSAREVAEKGQADLFAGTAREALAELKRLLRQSVAGQMVADVPLGAFLSGGYDSSLVVALMQSQQLAPVKTFTIGFREAGYDEAVHARSVAEYLQTDHTELYLAPKDSLELIPALPELYDEPFADSSQLPTCLVAALARKQVTVSLSGDGGDELFAGYPRYPLTDQLWRKLGWIPQWGRQVVARLLRSLPAAALDRLLGSLDPLFRKYGRSGPASDKVYKFAELLQFEDANLLYNRLVSHWKTAENPVLQAGQPQTLLNRKDAWAQLPELIQRLMQVDLVSYLPDDILVKVDRAAMGVSLESRIPLLDHRLVEFAWRLPLELKFHNGQGKWLLRQLLHQYLPKELVERPKMGFAIPLGDWLRGPLRDWAEALLAEERLQREGYFDPSPIRQRWQEHIAGVRQWQDYLWDVLMFQAWLERNPVAGQVSC